VSIAVLLLMLDATLPAQTASKPPSPSPAQTVQQVLAGVRASIATTIAKLPDVECQEQAHSVYLHNGKVKRDMTLNSTLQARRMIDKMGDFAEERTPAPGGSINGKPLKPGKKYSLPLHLTNGFGTTYEWDVSPKVEPCWTYKIISGTAEESNLIGLQATPKGVDAPLCGPPSDGKVAILWLDPVSYQIRRLHFVDPHAKLHLTGKIFISKYEPYYFVGTIDYHLVTLGQKQYLLPEKVHATAWAKELNSPDERVYDAQYSGCHIFRSTIKIITGPTVVAP
jgi:hypothetical protein